MKISIDISAVIYGTGVSVYTQHLVKHLLAVDDKNTYKLTGYSLRRISELRKFCNNLQGAFETGFIKLPPTAMDLLWNRLHTVRFENIFGDCDVYHSSDWVQAPSKAFKVTTVHDLVPILYPEHSLPNIVRVHKNRLNWVRKEVDRIIVPSVQTSSDLAKIGFDPKKISVIPEGIDEDLKPSDINMKTTVKNKFGIKKSFFLAVGITPRKNTNRILEAFRKIKKFGDYQLVIVGEAKISLQNQEDVIFTGFISRDELVALYSSTMALVYPSLYEGFGLPILEAAKCGSPVITSNLGAMKEVGQGIAILVDPYSVESIEKAMSRIIANPGDRFLDMAELNKYSWENTAKSTLEVYNQAIKS